MEKVKPIREKTEYYIQFSDEELAELGWEKEQDVSIQLKDGGIQISPLVKMELDTSDWPKELFEFLVSKSLEEKITVNDVIVNILNDFINNTSPVTGEQLICENGNV